MKQKVSEAFPTAATRAAGDTLGKVECYTMNAAELIGEFSDEFVDVEGSVVKFDFNTAVRLINLLWGKVKETARECEGKEIQVKLPDGLVGQLLAGVLGIVGIKL